MASDAGAWPGPGGRWHRGRGAREEGARSEVTSKTPGELPTPRCTGQILVVERKAEHEPA